MSTLIRWNARPARDLRGEVDRLFDGLFTGAHSVPAGEGKPSFVPPLDVEESKDEFVLKADLPGAKDVKVTLNGDTLTIRGERQPVRENDNNLHRTERIYGTFERTVTIATPVRGDQVKAVYRDGVLEIRIPKAEEAKVRDIDVQVS